MKIIKIKTDSIAHLSYFIVSDGEAAVIDPRRDSETYLTYATDEKAEIKYIFETHRNEDLVTGSRELRRHTEAEIYHGEGLDFEFGNFAKDMQEFELGSIKLKVLATPGHTPESISIAVYPDKDSEEAVGVFTGDTLFVDDVGRTDFFEDRKEEFAGKLYDSIFDKLLPLGEQTIIYPAHGAGSVCGGGIADREISTLGMEKTHNPMLQLSREKFIDRKVNEWHQYPPYFERMESINLKGNDRPLRNYDRFEFINCDTLEEKFDNYQVIDIRSCEAYLGAHIKDSLSIPKDFVGAYAGFYLNFEKEICLITDSVQGAVDYKCELRRLGYDNGIAILSGGVSSWATSARATRSIGIVDFEGAKKLHESGDVDFLDVRKPDEWEKGIIPGARTKFLGKLLEQKDEFSPKKKTVVYCGSGKRATIGASILKLHGLENVMVFAGSMKAWNSSN